MAAKKTVTGSVSVSKDLTFKGFCDKLNNGLYENLRGAKIAVGKAKWAPDDKVKANALVDQYFGRTSKPAAKPVPAPKKAPVAKVPVKEEEEEEENDEEEEERPPAAVEKAAPKKAPKAPPKAKGSLLKTQDKVFADLPHNSKWAMKPAYVEEMPNPPLFFAMTQMSSCVQLAHTAGVLDDEVRAQVRSMVMGLLSRLDAQAGGLTERKAPEGTVSLAIPIEVPIPEAPSSEETLPVSVLDDSCDEDLPEPLV